MKNTSSYIVLGFCLFLLGITTLSCRDLYNTDLPSALGKDNFQGLPPEQVDIQIFPHTSIPSKWYLSPEDALKNAAEIKNTSKRYYQSFLNYAIKNDTAANFTYPDMLNDRKLIDFYGSKDTSYKLDLHYIPQSLDKDDFTKDIKVYLRLNYVDASTEKVITSRYNLVKIKGYNSENNPWGIYKPTDLYSLVDTTNSFLLMNDLDLSISENNRELVTSGLNTNFFNIGWVPIQGFSGKLDGQFFKIQNLKIPFYGFRTAQYIDRVNGSKGFFKSLNKATIQNLYITDASISGQSELGILASNIGFDATIQNIYLSGSVDGTSIRETVGTRIDSYGGEKVGAVAGVFSGYADTVYVDATITGTTDLGGLFGIVEWESYLDHKAPMIKNAFIKGFVGSNVPYTPPSTLPAVGTTRPIRTTCSGFIAGRSIEKYYGADRSMIYYYGTVPNVQSIVSIMGSDALSALSLEDGWFRQYSATPLQTVNTTSGLVFDGIFLHVWDTRPLYFPMNGRFEDCMFNGRTRNQQLIVNWDSIIFPDKSYALQKHEFAFNGRNPQTVSSINFSGTISMGGFGTKGIGRDELSTNYMSIADYKKVGFDIAEFYKLTDQKWIYKDGYLPQLNIFSKDTKAYTLPYYKIWNRETYLGPYFE